MGSMAFNSIQSGTNTEAKKIVGKGSSLGYSGTGIIDATRFLGVTTVDATEFGYLDGITSGIQTQLDGKQGLDTDLTSLAGGISGIVKGLGNGNGYSAATGSDLNTTFGSQTANYIYAAPNGQAGNPAFRAMVMADMPTSVKAAQIHFDIDGGGSVITTGAKAWIRVPFNMTIQGWDITADQSGSIVVDVWKNSYVNFPPTVLDTIAGSEKPTLSAAQKNQNTNLTTWTTAVSAGDYIRINVDSASTVTKVCIDIYGVKN